MCPRVLRGRRERGTGATWLFWEEDELPAGEKTPSSSNICSLVDTLIFIGSEKLNLCSPLPWKAYWGRPATSRPLSVEIYGLHTALSSRIVWECGWDGGREGGRGERGEGETARDLAQPRPLTCRPAGPRHPALRTSHPWGPLRDSALVGPMRRQASAFGERVALLRVFRRPFWQNTVLFLHSLLPRSA